MIVRGQGVRVYDQAGKDYIDCTSQSWAMYLGYANPEINRVVAEQMERMSHVHQGFDTPPRYWLARKLAPVNITSAPATGAPVPSRTMPSISKAALSWLGNGPG